MKKNFVHETEIEELSKPGRFMRWLVTPENMGAEHLSVNLIRVPAGETVKPAHSHPNGEEVIYIMSGTGKVYIDGNVDAVSAGTAVLFRQGAVHMLRNDGSDEMKVICFFAPASDLSTYRFFEEIEFPE